MKKFFPFLLLISGILLLSSFVKHPYHVGSVEFNYNSKTKTFEISGRFFMDDLENAVSKKFGKKLYFQDARYKNEMSNALQKYLEDYLKLKVNSKNVKINYMEEYLKLKTNNKFLNIRYIGFEEDHESVEVYLESETVNRPAKIETAVSILYNLFDDQMNIVHIIVNGQRKSDKLTYPNRYLYQQF